jgi:thiosulfate reductase/polysulfide reductase chain A
MAMSQVDLSAQLAQLKGAKVVKGFCYSCPWTCATEVYVRDNQVVYVRGNALSPYNLAGRCGRGMASPWVTRDPDRLKHPMRRKGAKGSRQFERVSWDTAFEIVAENLTRIRERWGPESVVFLFHHDPNSVFASIFLTQLYGTPNFYGHTAGCEMDRRYAVLTLFGHPFPVNDFGNARYMMLWGMNILGAPGGLFDPRSLLEAKRRGARLVVVDPNHTVTAAKADEWVPIRPGTDGALALAMARVIIDESRYDRAFVEQACHGFPGFGDHLRASGYTPEWAEPITGVAKETIVRLAREVATVKPALITAFKGPGYYTNGADATRAIYILAAITGNVDNPGNLILKDWAPLSPPVAIPEEARTKPQRPPLHVAMGYPLAPDLPTGLLPQAVLEGTPYPVKSIWVQNTNPVMSDMDRDRVIATYRGLEFGLAIDLYMSETALECDLVLPETSFYEHAEIRQGLWIGPDVVFCEPAIPPVGEAKPLYEIIQGIAGKMGWGQHFAYRTWEDWARTALKTMPVTLDELRQKGFWTGQVRHGHPLGGKLGTATGKIEIHSESHAKHGQNPYPVFRERAVLPDDEYPLQLTHSKLPTHTNVLTQNNRYAMEIDPENWVEIHRADAQKYGVRDGEYVALESPKSQIRIRAKVVEGLRPGVVSVRHGQGFGHWAQLSRAQGRGAHSNSLQEIHVTPVSGGNAYNECKVRVRPA